MDKHEQINKGIPSKGPYNCRFGVVAYNPGNRRQDVLGCPGVEASVRLRVWHGLESS